MFIPNAYGSGTIHLPEASDIASRVDTLYNFLFWLSLFFLILVTYLIVNFAIKYNRNKTGRTTEYILGNHQLEFMWTVIPLLIMLFVFGWGYRDYLEMKKDRTPDFELNVIGRQWMWNFEYPNGVKTLNTLYLPKDKVVRLIMTSEDVLHDFFIPNFRIKQDVVPNMYTSLIFKTTEAGIQPVYCAEYCGTGHSDMLANVVVMEGADFDRWYDTGEVPKAIKEKLESLQRPAVSATTQGHEPASTGMSTADKGKGLVQSKGCFACHSTDGTAKVGPSFKGIFGTKVEFTDGSSATVDENYIRESMVEPNKKVVKGFVPSMPTFKGQLSDEEMNALIAYIKSLK